MYIKLHVINDYMNLISLIGKFENERPSWDDYFVIMSHVISKRSTCNKVKVGAIITNNNRIISTGYNGHIPKTDHISISRDGHEMATIHAETNAVCDASKRGVSLDGSTVYVTHYPCINCTKVLIAAGIREIIYSEDYYNDDIATQMLGVANVKIRKYSITDTTQLTD